MSSLTSLTDVFIRGEQELRPASGEIATFSFTGDISLVDDAEKRQRIIFGANYCSVLNHIEGIGTDRTGWMIG